MQVHMINNTICARSFSVSRLILAGGEVVLSSWSRSKNKKTSNLQGEMFKVNLEIAKNLKRSNKASRFEVSSPCKGGYKLIIVFCAKFVMYVRH